MEKKLHHYVPRFYLKAWAHKKLVWCLRDREIIHPNLRNVAAENNFYKLKELTPGDVSFIRELAVNDSPEALKPIHEQFLSAFCEPHRAKRELELSENATAETIAEISQAIANMNEDLHTSIEESFRPYLRSMLEGDADFYSSPAEAALFFRGIATQYLRTNQIRKGAAMLSPERFRIFQRVQNVVVHIFALNVGLNLYLHRDRYRIILIDNESDVPFVTADQPIINIEAKPKQSIPPERFSLYYPLSPKKAMILLESDSSFFPKERSIDAAAAHHYNLLMAAHSYEQIFSVSRQYLEVIKAQM